MINCDMFLKTEGLQTEGLKTEGLQLPWQLISLTKGSVR